MPDLALATWNVLHGLRVGRDAGAGAPDTDGLLAGAATLDVDVLGLQEVDRDQPRSASVDQAAVVADRIGAPWWRFVPAVHGTPGQAWQASVADDGATTTGPTYGVALVSRLPVRRWHVLRFPPARGTLPLLVPGRGLVRVPDEPRVAVAAELELPGGGVATVATCHLSFVPVANARQLRRTCAWLATLPGPRLLLGDLNLPGRLPAVVSRWTQLARGATYPSWRPRVQWDHVLAEAPEAFRVMSAEVRRLPVSDHAALRVSLER